MATHYNGETIRALLQKVGELEIMWIDGKIEFIRQPFNGAMDCKEFDDLILKIQSEMQRGKMKLKVTGNYIDVYWERSIK